MFRPPIFSDGDLAKAPTNGETRNKEILPNPVGTGVLDCPRNKGQSQTKGEARKSILMKHGREIEANY